LFAKCSHSVGNLASIKLLKICCSIKTPSMLL
jgi:hypothetical protein